MAELSWPTMLPTRPLLAGYGLEVDGQVLRSSIEQGLGRQRRRGPTAITTVRARWTMTPNQMEFFKAWATGRAAFGGAWFDIVLPIGAGAAETTVEARFVGSPRYTPAGTVGWHVDAQIETREVPA